MAAQVDTAVLLAAGRGSRLNGQGRPKPLVPFMGMPLLERSVRSLMSCGIQRFVVVTGFRHEEVEEFAQALSRRLGIEVECVFNSQWEKENGLSLYAARAKVSSPFLLAMTDHLLSTELIEAALASAPPPGGLVLAVDKRLDNRLVDPADVTKVQVEGDRITAIGKGLNAFNAYDTGLFSCSADVFREIEKAVEAGKATLSEMVMYLARKGVALACETEGAFWADLDDAEAFRRAEEEMLRLLRGKGHDGPVSRFLNRPISIRLSRRLVWTDITPNQITLLSFALAVAAAFFLSRESYLWFAAGGILAQMASIVDGCDGEIARIKWLQSDYGAWLDAVLDRYADACLLAGITWHVANYRLAGAQGWLLGIIAIVGSLINSYTADKYDGWIRRRKAVHRFRLGRDVRIFLLLLSSIFYRPVELLAVLAGIMNIENFRRIWALRTA